MGIWEYKFINIFQPEKVEITPEKMPSMDMFMDMQIKRLNDLGAGGWEFSALLPAPYPPGTALLKRHYVKFVPQELPR